jgi:uncharacterized protein YdeI (YjbR/CyaY-like superfamily)
VQLPDADQGAKRNVRGNSRAQTEVPKWNSTMRMPGMKVRFFKSPSELRAWFKANHDKQRELWIGFHKIASGKPSVTYSEAVEQALCFGWIDGVKKSVDATSYTHRFSPRKATSKWSVINLERARKLAATGSMDPAGLKALERANVASRAYSYEQRNAARLNEAEERQFRESNRAWEFFQAQAPWYRRTASWWVISAKKEETRQKRLVSLIAHSLAQETIPPLTRKPRVRKRNPNR